MNKGILAPGLHHPAHSALGALGGSLMHLQVIPVVLTVLAVAFVAYLIAAQRPPVVHGQEPADEPTIVTAGVAGGAR